jgi:rhodanese-related sulfurtransferase
MKSIHLQLVSLAILFLLFSCSPSGNKEKAAEKQVQKVAIEVNSEAALLLKYLEETGDYVNSRNFPSLIKASFVHDELAAKNHIIDLRSPEEFKAGHIKGAVNVSFTALPEYLETKIKPFEFGKVILVCATGQVSSYAASLLRLTGYGNVYAMRWGMSAWNKKYADNFWLKGISSEWENRLDTIDVPSSEPADLPLPGTGKTSGEEILNERFRKVMAEGSEVALITAAEVFAAPENYYIINFERKDKYDSGHIPGAVRYKQNATLGILAEMQTIPAGKPIVIYCGTGHNSAFASAYLRLFGYDARTLMFGNNSFMYNHMVKDEKGLSWLPFSESDIHDYEVVK